MSDQELYIIIPNEENIELYDFVNHSILYSSEFKDLPLNYYDLHVYNLTSDCIYNDSMIL